MQLSFQDVFQALSTLTDALPTITGVDIWRRATNEPNLAQVDPSLLDECVTPPSKREGIFTGKKGTVWDTLHFVILLPALQQLASRSETDELNSFELDEDQAIQAFGAFAHLKRHIAQYHEWEDRLPDILDNLPPEPSNLDPELRRFFEGEIKEQPDNHIVGRLLQAYYIQTNRRYRLNGAPRRMAPYLENSKGLFDRTQRYVMNRLQSCPLPVDSSGRVPDIISASDLLKTYSWFSCPTVVEMVLPNLKGAAAKAAISLSAFLEDINMQTGQDLRDFDVDFKTMQSLQNNKELLWRFEKVTLILDALNKRQAGDALDKINCKIWTQKQRQDIWNSHNEARMPDSILHDAIQYAQTLSV